MTVPGIRAPNLPPGSGVISAFVGLQSEGSTKSLRLYPRNEVLGAVDAVLSGAQVGGGVVFTSKAQANSHLAYDEMQMALVTSDATTANNGLYQKNGASGSGTWVRIADLPNEVITFLVTGGTADAIIATVSPQVPTSPASKLFLLTPAAPNTGPVTINGVAIKNAFGLPLAAGSLLENSPAMMTWNGAGAYYQLVMAANVDADTFVAAAQAAALEAVQAAEDAVIAGGVVTEYLPGVMAWKEGVPGDGVDRTAALQTIFDGLPSGRGLVWLKDNVSITALDLAGKSYIHIKGLGKGKTYIYLDAGAIGAGVPVIDCYGARDITFEDLSIYALDPTFDGIAVRCGAIAPGSTDTPNIKFINVDFGGASIVSTATMLWLYGATLTKLTGCGIAAVGGKPIQLQNVVGTYFSNNITFTNCNFSCGAVYPVQGSGDDISFIGCNFQNASDGKGYAYESDATAIFREVSFDKCTFYADYLPTGGSVWIKAKIGHNISVTNCVITGGGALNYGIELGGGTNADPNVSGVMGFDVRNNYCEGLSALIKFSGSTAPGTLSCARGGDVRTNSLSYLSEMFANVSNCATMEWGFSNSYALTSTSGVGFTPGYIGLPGAAAGSLYGDSGIIKIAP